MIRQRTRIFLATAAALSWGVGSAALAQADFTASVMGGVFAGMSGKGHQTYSCKTAKPETVPTEWRAQNARAVDEVVAGYFAAWSRGDTAAMSQAFFKPKAKNMRLSDGTIERVALTNVRGPSGPPRRLWIRFADKGWARGAWSVGPKTYVISLGRKVRPADAPWKLGALLEAGPDDAAVRAEPQCNAQIISTLW